MTNREKLPFKLADHCACLVNRKTEEVISPCSRHGGMSKPELQSDLLRQFHEYTEK